MLSEKIKKLRQSKHYSQKQIAIKLGITQGAVSQWELGLTEPGADQLIALAQIFDTTVYELKGIDDPTKKEPVKKNGLRETVADMIVNLPQDDLPKLLEYIDFLKSRRGAS